MKEREFTLEERRALAKQIEQLTDDLNGLPDTNRADILFLRGLVMGLELTPERVDSGLILPSQKEIDLNELMKHIGPTQPVHKVYKRQTTLAEIMAQAGPETELTEMPDWAYPPDHPVVQAFLRGWRQQEGRAQKEE